MQGLLLNETSEDDLLDWKWVVVEVGQLLLHPFRRQEPQGRLTSCHTARGQKSSGMANG